MLRVFAPCVVTHCFEFIEINTNKIVMLGATKAVLLNTPPLL